MENWLYFILCGLIFSICLNVIFFVKKHVKTGETKVFSILLIVNLLSLFSELICIYIGYNYPENSIAPHVATKIFLLFLMTFLLYMTLYIYIICYVANEKKDIKHYDFLKKLSYIVWIICCFGCLILPIVTKKGYATGLAVSWTYTCSTLVLISWGIPFAKNRKSLSRKKIIPLLLFVIFMALIAIVQRYNPQITLTTVMEFLVLFVMYHTIENPDIKLINELNMAKDQAEKANRAKTDFLSSMSHEIRTPLNAIVGFSNSLNDNKDIPESAKADVKDILVASDNLLEIVNGVLDISKIEANKIEIIKKEYDTKKMFDELSKLTKVRIGEKPIEFITKFDESLPRVLYGDQTRVKQVILNILTNAAKYTDKGKIIFSVQSIIKDNVCRMIVSVEDTGRGIKKESIDKLFTKFERLDEDRNTTIEGTGLGLAITKKLVELMRGKIVVQSKYGEGSKFTVSIDQKIVKNPTISLDDNSNTNLEVIDLKGKKVLVVDDNKLNLKVATRLLTPYNLEIVTSESGFDAIELLKNNKYDIILMDDMMPKMSGTETLKEIQKNELYDGPVVALTANALTGMKEKYIELGFTDYLAKPIEKAELNRVLKTYLTKK